MYWGLAAYTHSKHIVWGDIKAWNELDGKKLGTVKFSLNSRAFCSYLKSHCLNMSGCFTLRLKYAVNNAGTAVHSGKQ